MFNKIKKMKPEDVHFTLENGKPCFYAYRAFTRRNNMSDEKEEFTQKQLDQISRELFDIEQFNKNRPERKGMWQLIEKPVGQKSRCWIIKFFPFTGVKNPEDSSEDLKAVLELMYR